jgi:hypothetical protein
MALYEEVCAACQQDRMIAIDYSPAEKPCAHYPGAPEQVDWGDTLLWCDCDETGEELDAMVKRYRHKAEDAYARGYDDL